MRLKENFSNAHEICFFLKNNLNFFIIGKGGRFDVECVSNNIISQNCFFPPKLRVFEIRKKLIGKDYQTLLKIVFFRKNGFILLKVILAKLESGRYVGD